MRDDRERLQDILDAIEGIERHVPAARAKLDRDELVQVWILHHLRVIGEAVRELTPALLTEHPELPRSEIVGMRNILVHHYFGIDLDIVWNVIKHDLPLLKRSVEALLRELGGPAEGR